MIIFQIPFFYITSKIASEKESKVREGMKMMGLNDSIYYLSWLIVYSFISMVISLIVSIMICFILFKNISFFLFFVFCMIYSTSLLSISFILISFLPTKKSSGIAAVLINFITFFLSAVL